MVIVRVCVARCSEVAASEDLGSHQSFIVKQITVNCCSGGLEAEGRSSRFVSGGSTVLVPSLSGKGQLR